MLLMQYAFCKAVCHVKLILFTRNWIQIRRTVTEVSYALKSRCVMCTRQGRYITHRALVTDKTAEGRVTTDHRFSLLRHLLGFLAP
jgi:hypothetical protein